MTLKTPFAGLDALAPGEPLSSDGFKFQSIDRYIIDRMLRIGDVTHRHDAHAAMANPVLAVAPTTAATGGAIPASTPIYVTYTLLDTDGGETLPVAPVSITTAAGFGDPFDMPGAVADYAAGTLLAGNYSYAATVTDGHGGETAISPAALLTVDPGHANAEATISGLTLLTNDSSGGAVGAGWRLWRSKDGGPWYLIGTGPAATDGLVDNGIAGDCSVAPPATGTTVGANTLTVTVPGGQPAAAVNINIYASLDGSFTSPALIGTYPVPGGGGPLVVTYTGLLPAEGAPPAVSTCLPGANQINPDTDILNWTWKRPVANFAALPALGNTDGDARVTLDNHHINIWDGAAWHDVTVGGVSSVFGRTGAVVATTGDYAVAQVTGAAPLASPALTGTPTAPTAAPLDNSTKLSTTAYADAAVGVEKTRALAAEALAVLKANNGSDFADSGSTRLNLNVPTLTPCAAVSTANVAALSGLLTIDGHVLAAGEHVLLTAQTTASQNGPWVAAAGAWTRPTSYPSAGVVTARTVAIISGTVGAGQMWLLQTNGSVTVDTTATTWVNMTAGGSGAPTGPAGGDLSGTYPNPGVAKLNGVAADAVTTKADLLVANATPALKRLGIGADGQVLTADSAQTLGMKWAAGGGGTSTPPPNLQNGIVNSTDLALSAISINTGTGALSFTLAAVAQSCYVNSAGGVLTAVTFAGGAQTPGAAAPASTKYAVVGVEIDTAGAISVVKGADTATQLNTAPLIASNSPATSAGKLRLFDFAIWNNAGTFNFSDHTTVASVGVNWIDRRPWARGGYASIVRTQNAAAGNDYTAPTSIAAIDATNLTIRLECTGNPIRTRLKFRSPGNASILFKFFPWMDGTYISPMDSSDSSFVFTQTGEGGWEFNWEFAPSAGSHSFTWATLRASGTNALVLYARADIPLEFLVEELLRPAANNGTV